MYPGSVRVADLDRAIEQHLLQRDDTGGDRAELALAPQPQGRGDLVVAAPPGVQLAADLAGDLGDPSLDRRVDVLVRRLELERPAGELAGDAVERGEDRRGFVAVEQPRPHQAADMRARACDVVRGKPLVEAHRRGERQQLVGRARPETAVPERHDPSAPS